MVMMLLLDGWPMLLAGYLKKVRARLDKIDPIIIQSEVFSEKVV